jgi:type I site-specific restriction-modification system R (restriction) subunit
MPKARIWSSAIKLHHLLLNGVPVEYKHEDKVIHDNALLMDFNHPDNNRFMVVNQVAIQGKTGPSSGYHWLSTLAGGGD